MSNFMELVSVDKVYKNGEKDIFALRNINLILRESEYLAIIGPSGAGKSTLIHIMGGLQTPTKGEVLFQGRNIYKMKDSSISLWRSKVVGFVFQFYHLIEELTVLENVANAFKKAKELLKYLGIEEKREAVPSQLSGGEKQKVAIARALVNSPKVILCDEPTGNLDRDSAQKVINFLEWLNVNEGKTLVIVTHNTEIVKRADRVMKIKDGEIRKS
ncbi:MAG: hypothetical protein B6D56_04885 [Candidatus Omnitrophica bacterium 4484_70.1]|nr:MAG: hypothetical protein B6D56_04885 [Candidatus Omnitrophica bacterium 4484_70.1]